MSYDLMVFDPNAAPTERNEFVAWYRKQTEWSEPHSYNDPHVATDRLRAWFMDMIKRFPAMNGPFASKNRQDCDDARVSDYCIGQVCICTGFAWSIARDAYEATFKLAEEHSLGFYDVSSEWGEVWLPDRLGKLVVVHTESKPITGYRVIPIAFGIKIPGEDEN